MPVLSALKRKSQNSAWRLVREEDSSISVQLFLVRSNNAAPTNNDEQWLKERLQLILRRYNDCSKYQALRSATTAPVRKIYRILSGSLPFPDISTAFPDRRTAVDNSIASLPSME